MIPNLKLKGKAEGGFIRKLSAGSHRVRGGGRETQQRRGVPVQCRRPSATVLSNEGRNRNEYTPLGPGVGTSVYPGEVQLLE